MLLKSKLKNRSSVSPQKAPTTYNEENFLFNSNNYLRTASYRKNYQKKTRGKNVGKYINLDFAYLKELSVLDMHFRIVVNQLCLDIEHDLKIYILQEIEQNNTSDGYDLVKKFISTNIKLLDKLVATKNSVFTRVIFVYKKLEK